MQIQYIQEQYQKQLIERQRQINNLQDLQKKQQIMYQEYIQKHRQHSRDNCHIKCDNSVLPTTTPC